MCAMSRSCVIRKYNKDGANTWMNGQSFTCVILKTDVRMIAGYIWIKNNCKIVSNFFFQIPISLIIIWIIYFSLTWANLTGNKLRQIKNHFNFIPLGPFPDQKSNLSLYSPKVTLWCAISLPAIASLCFFTKKIISKWQWIQSGMRMSWRNLFFHEFIKDLRGHLVPTGHAQHLKGIHRWLFWWNTSIYDDSSQGKI